MIVLEPCPTCGEPRVLLPSRGRDGGRRLCVACGHADRRGDIADVAAAAALVLFGDEREVDW
jgi:Zn ribbon nucleic-acid-binding protein